eukprot:g31859.t1
MRHAAPPRRNTSGSHLLGLGVRCSEYFAALTRTLLVNPPNEMKQAYMRMHQLHKKVVEFVVPGEGGAVTATGGPGAKVLKGCRLLDRMVSDIFSPTCTNSKHDPEEKNAVLTEGCERKVVVPSVFVVSVGLEPDRNGEGAIWLSDTVLVTEQQREVLTSRSGSTPKEAFFELDPPDEEGHPAPAVPPKPAPEERPAPSRQPPEAKAKAKGAAREPRAAPRERSRSREAAGRGRGAPSASTVQAKAKPKAEGRAKPVKAPAPKPETKKPKAAATVPQATPVRRSARQQAAPPSGKAGARTTERTARTSGPGAPPAAGRSMRSSTLRAKESINEQAALDRLQPALRSTGGPGFGPMRRNLWSVLEMSTGAFFGQTC